jgi:hypothetical protein
MHTVLYTAPAGRHRVLTSVFCCQALSLPVTNIAFTLKIFMGDAAEPLTALDLLGLVLVCIGFLTYSGFGLASNFMVAQVAPRFVVDCSIRGDSQCCVYHYFL